MNQTNVSQDQILDNLSNQSNWVRLLYMLIYGVMLHLAGIAMWILCTVQFVCTLIFGKDNDSLRRLAASLIDFIQQALQFVSYNSDDKPFPFADDKTATAQDKAPDAPGSDQTTQQTTEQTTDQTTEQAAEPTPHTGEVIEGAVEPDKKPE